MNSKRALVIVDAQVNMFADQPAVFDAQNLLAKLGQLIVRARQAGMLVVYVQNNGGAGDPDQPGTPGWEIHPALPVWPDDVVVQKHTPDAFHETGLQAKLEERQVGSLIVAGMQSEMCIESTCRRAHELGYALTLVKDAHSTFDQNGQTAAQMIDQVNTSLAPLVNFMTTGEV